MPKNLGRLSIIGENAGDAVARDSRSPRLLTATDARQSAMRS